MGADVAAAVEARGLEGEAAEEVRRAAAAALERGAASVGEAVALAAGEWAAEVAAAAEALKRAAPSFLCFGFCMEIRQAAGTKTSRAALFR